MQMVAEGFGIGDRPLFAGVEIVAQCHASTSRLFSARIAQRSGVVRHITVEAGVDVALRFTVSEEVDIHRGAAASACMRWLAFNMRLRVDNIRNRDADMREGCRIVVHSFSLVRKSTDHA